MNKVKVLSVNISEKKGTVKKPVSEVFLSKKGVLQDAHSGSWHRQISLLGSESIQKFEHKAKRKIEFGEFAENITTEGIELYKTHPLDILKNDNIVLEITQIGKECHGDSCSIFREVGNCVMPKEGIFARVVKEGSLKVGDELFYYPKIYKVLILTLSDRASSGEYEDRSGKRIKEIFDDYFTKKEQIVTFNYKVIPDEVMLLESEIQNAVSEGADIIVTTGGTGIGPRDITPDVVKPLLDKEIPGIMEMIRWKYGQNKPAALLSRSIAGIIDKTLVYTLPGSLRAVNEYMEEILKTLEHLILMQHSIDAH
jgi:molybdenum cofactor synthesis domain-containing protein